MKKAVLLVPREWGGFLPTLPLAETLVNHGWDVVFFLRTGQEVYARSNNIPNVIEEHGFRYVDLAPADGRQSTQEQNIGVLVDKLAEESCNLLLAQDGTLINASLAAQRSRRPIVALYTHLGFFPSLASPPISSSYIPSRSLVSRCVIAWEWFRRLLPYLPFRLIRPLLLRRRGLLGLRSGFNGFQYIGRVEHGVFLGPAAFDFPTSRKRICFGHHVRKRDANVTREAWAWPPGAKPRIFCSLGEYAHRSRRSQDALRTLCASFRAHEEWAVIVQVGKIDPATLINQRPPNVHFYEWVPQQTILQQADLAITNGGFGTIKECIEHETPMLVIPIMFDQPGNAARVAFHKIGLSAGTARNKEAQLTRLIETLLADPTFEQNIQSFKTGLALDREREAAETMSYLESLVT